MIGNGCIGFSDLSEINMILENELHVVTEKRIDETSFVLGPHRTSPRIHLAVFFAFLSAVVLLQLASGAYHAEFGGYPDEPAHYVTSVMVRNYIAGLKPVSPMQFARDYYQHYPKVALGHWPPLFYLFQAVWMLLFSISRAAVRLQIAFTSALLAFAVYSEARRWMKPVAAFFAGLLTVCLPLVQTYSDQEMAESLLVLTCFLAAVFFARYMETEQWRPCLLFALFFSLAVLTKGSGWLLALVPPITLLLTRKFNLLRRPQLWVAAAIVTVLCLPWQFMTMRLVEQGWTGGEKPSLDYTVSALGEFLVILEQIGGPALTVLTLLGIGLLVVKPAVRRVSVSPGPATMFSFIIAVWLFHSLVPAGVENRKMVIAAPALVLFLFVGGEWFAGRLPLPQSLNWRYFLTASVAALSFFLTTFQIPRDEHYGYDEAARFICNQPSLRSATLLVSSGSIGEGLLISEMAMLQPYPRCTILRATKTLAHVNWDASSYRCLFSSPSQLLQYLDSHGVTAVAVDNFRSADRFDHIRLLQEAIDHSARFRLLGQFSNGSAHPPGSVLIYKLLPPTP